MVLRAHRRKTAMKTAMFASYLLSVKPPAVATSQPSVTKPLMTKANPAPPPQLVQLFV
jgi:hypothetical protein